MALIHSSQLIQLGFFQLGWVETVARVSVHSWVSAGLRSERKRRRARRVNTFRASPIHPMPETTTEVSRTASTLLHELLPDFSGGLDNIVYSRVATRWRKRCLN